VRKRVIGAVLVVIVSLVPLFFGGPIFTLYMVVLGIAGYREYLQLVARLNPGGLGSSAEIGYAVVAGWGCAALVDDTTFSLLTIAFLSVVSPLIQLFSGPKQPGAFSDWSFASTGSLYLGIPIYAAVATRSRSGTVDAHWLAEAAGRFAFGWDPAPRGLAWILTVVLATWVGDSVALFAGRTFGKRKLAPIISPNKSQEGAIGGILASMVVGAVSFQGFGLSNWKLGLIAGAVIGLAGQIGDLAESVMKRQAGVKDSGSLVPGHGGVLDRIDALLFAFPAGFLMAVGLERIGG
jgi:phosphatidate cytidylyltransferase